MKNRKYWIAKNSYGNSTSLGFSNSWDYMYFDSKIERTRYINKYISQNISIHSIPASEPFKGLTKWQKLSMMENIHFWKGGVS
jgi:hypothetical protein